MPAGAVSVRGGDQRVRVRRSAGRGARADEARRPARPGPAAGPPAGAADGRGAGARTVRERRRRRARAPAPVQAAGARIQPGAGAGPLGAGGTLGGAGRFRRAATAAAGTSTCCGGRDPRRSWGGPGRPRGSRPWLGLSPSTSRRGCAAAACWSSTTCSPPAPRSARAPTRWSAPAPAPCTCCRSPVRCDPLEADAGGEDEAAAVVLVAAGADQRAGVES